MAVTPKCSFGLKFPYLWGLSIHVYHNVAAMAKVTPLLSDNSIRPAVSPQYIRVTNQTKCGRRIRQTGHAPARL